MSEWREAVQRQPANLAAAAAGVRRRHRRGRPRDAAPRHDRVRRHRRQRPRAHPVGAGAARRGPPGLRAAGDRARRSSAPESWPTRSSWSPSRVPAPRPSPRWSRSRASRWWPSPPAATARWPRPPTPGCRWDPSPTLPWPRSPTPRRCRRWGCCATRCWARPGRCGRSCPRWPSDVLESGAGPAAALAADFAGVTALEAVGGGPGLASARETALLAREALRLPATGMETREYLHGPLEAVAHRLRRGRSSAASGSDRWRASMASFGARVAVGGRPQRRRPGRDRCPRCPPSPRPSCRSSRSSCSSTRWPPAAA